MINDATGQDDGLSRREREKLQHRQEILGAAVKVFAEKGFYHATLDEVAQKAEFSKGALYLYFTSKEDMLHSIISMAFEWWWSFMKQTLSGDHSFREELTALYKGLGNKAFDVPDYFTVITEQHFSLFKGLTEDRRGDLIDCGMKEWRYIQARVDKAIADGELKNMPSIAVAGLVHGAMDGIINNRWQCSTREDLMEAIDNFMEIIFTGLEP
jgi:TetR/AcrR family transcriptional regulator, repressor of fatR-cypB operon